LSLLNHPPRRQLLAHNAAQFVHLHCGWEAVTSAFESCLFA
jgi:hypothetical protein